MKLLCRLGRHEAVATSVWNEGYYFTTCRVCGGDLVGRAGEWRAVPKGYRVVWRPRPDDYPDWKPFTGADGRSDRLSVQ